MTMPAIRWHDRLDVRLDEVPEIAVPAPGMATVSVELCGLCGTDVAEYLYGPVIIRRGPHPLSGQGPPITLGHEFFGRIAAVPEDEVIYEAGQRVTVDACWRCGRCHFCVRGDYHRCLIGGSVGFHSDGGLSPLTQVPLYTLVPVPDAVDGRAAALAEPLAVGIHAVDRAGLFPGAAAAIVGFGPIGAASAVAARLAGAHVLVVEILAERRALAARFGFEEIIDPSAVSLRKEVQGLTDGLGADAVLDCTGNPTLLADSLELTRRGGVLVLAGLGAGTAKIDANRIVLTERRIVGTLGYRHDLPRALTLMADGRLDATSFISEEVMLDDAIDGGLKALAEDRGRFLKILVRCSG